MEWDALTDREPSAWYREERDRLSDMARDANRSGLFEELRKHPTRVNLPRIGIRTGYAPLHQAAWHGAAFPVVSRLIAHGVWRTQRTRDGQRAVDIARKQGHTHLLELLEPVVVRPLGQFDGCLMRNEDFEKFMEGLVEYLQGVEANRMRPEGQATDAR
ncbi:ankyrin repeat domain-containing protein [Streptomyces sp. STR69]|uniref:ankyrin repeat domain-containing protein n=1 Tax=Streptomyces sp. STR69 TaxID=1796942 RepID=UPI0021C9771D|nr:ankyrin repeat domain-containing protein [Streptomyces sp. STR69]